MWKYNHTDELRHFGVKGMRWGHRKAPDLSGIKNRAEKTAYAIGAKLNPREAKYKVRKIVMIEIIIHGFFMSIYTNAFNRF